MPELREGPRRPDTSQTEVALSGLDVALMPELREGPRRPDTSQTEVALCGLDVALAEVEDHLSVMIERIDSVLEPAQINEVHDEPPPHTAPAPMSPLVDRIQGVRMRVNQLCCRVSGIISRLQI